MVTPHIIETQGLTKIFGKFKALDNVSVKIPSGAIGLLGPNGAGKSTFMKCLLELMVYTKGEAQLLGLDVKKHGASIRQRVGYLPERDCHIPGLVGCEYVTYCAQLSGLPFNDARQRAHEMLDFVGLGDERYRPVESYSTGMKQRLKLAQAIVHDPELVFLDEPTNGLDPAGRVQILELIKALWTEHKMSVVLSSHLLQDVSRVCDHIVIMAHGQVLENENIAVLKSRKKPSVEILVNERHQDLIDKCQSYGMICQSLPSGRIKVETQQDDINQILGVANELKIIPQEIVPSPDMLEELFLQAVGEQEVKAN